MCRKGAHRLTRLCAARSLRALFPMTTFSAKASEISRKWGVIDASDQVLGTVAVKAANLLRGKEKTVFTPHVDKRDFVTVINAEKVRPNGNKEEQHRLNTITG